MQRGELDAKQVQLSERDSTVSIVASKVREACGFGEVVSEWELFEEGIIYTT
jgi:hypothetical protein